MDGGNRSNAVDCADLATLIQGSVQTHRTEMSDKAVLGSYQTLFKIGLERRECACAIATGHSNITLIEGRPQFHTIAEILKTDLGKSLIPIGEIGVSIAALFHQTLGQIPVKNVHKRCDVMLQQLVDDLIVKLNALGVYLAIAGGNNARPSDGKTIGVLSGLGHILDVLFVMIVEEATTIRHFGGVGLALTLGDRAARQLLGNESCELLGIVIHYAGALSIPVPSAFTLESRIRGSDQKVLTKLKTKHIFSP